MLNKGEVKGQILPVTIGVECQKVNAHFAKPRSLNRASALGANVKQVEASDDHSSLSSNRYLDPRCRSLVYPGATRWRYVSTILLR